MIKSKKCLIVILSVILLYALAVVNAPLPFLLMIIIVFHFVLPAAFFLSFSSYFYPYYKRLFPSSNISKLKFELLLLGGFYAVFYGTWFVDELPFPEVSFLQDVFRQILIALLILFFVARTVIPLSKKIFVRTLLLLLILIQLASLRFEISDSSEDSRWTEQLLTLPYLGGSDIIDSNKTSGVILYNKENTFPGFNLYISFKAKRVLLLNMAGKSVHFWRLPPSVHDTSFVGHAELDHNGDLYVIEEDKAIMKLDWHGELLWRHEYRMHHDIAFHENGDIYTLMRDRAVLFRKGIPVPLLDDYVAIFSEDGQFKEKISLGSTLLSEIVPAKRVWLLYWRMLNPGFAVECLRYLFGVDEYLLKGNSEFDLFHTNTLELMRRGIPGISKKGDFLLASRNQHQIMLADFQTYELLWRWGNEEVKGVHQPTLLDNGNILLFDNGMWRDWSRVIELDPLQSKIVWRYTGKPKESFYSFSRSGAERLPNGNTLITEGDAGRVIEVTPDHEVVWEFLNPVSYNDGQKREAIYRMSRYYDLEAYPKLKELVG